MVYPLDAYNLAITAIITACYQLVFFVLAYVFQFDKLTDFAGGTNFIVLTVVTLVLRNRPETYSSSALQYEPLFPRQIVASVCLLVWAARLTAFLFYRVLVTGRDERFDNTRNRFFPFLGFFVGQMCWVWTVSMPVSVINSEGALRWAPYQHGFGTARDIVGVVMFAVGFLCETVADAQKFMFRLVHRQNKLAFCHTGLFAISRHPNYFGEILLQFGIWLIVSSAAGDKQVRWHSAFGRATYASVTGAIFTAVCLLFASGMNLSERPGAVKRYVAAHGSDAAPEDRETWQAYQRWLQRTSILIPLPPVVYAHVPTIVKRTLLFEYPLYVFNPDKHAAVAKESSPKKSTHSQTSDESNEA